MKTTYHLLFLLIIISSFLSYKFAYYLGEKYFFDKLFYRKNINFGYWVQGKNLTLENFLPRSKDIIHLIKYDYVLQDNRPSIVLGSSTDIFTIALIGDSFVWGQGVKDEDRLPNILEKKLNAVRKTKVLSLALDGDSALDNLLKYQIAKKIYPVNLFIFVLVENDLAFNKEAKYGKEAYDSILNECKTTHIVEPIYFDLDNVEFTPTKTIQQQYNDTYINTILPSFHNDTNLCVLRYVSQRYPKTNAIYFIPDDYTNDRSGYEVYKQYLSNEGLYILSSNVAKSYPDYQRYWNNPTKNFRVSEIEQHPSTLANRMYSEVLFQEITSNLEWKFKNY